MAVDGLEPLTRSQFQPMALQNRSEPLALKRGKHRVGVAIDSRSLFMVGEMFQPLDWLVVGDERTAIALLTKRQWSHGSRVPSCVATMSATGRRSNMRARSGVPYSLGCWRHWAVADWFVPSLRNRWNITL